MTFTLTAGLFLGWFLPTGADISPGENILLPTTSSTLRLARGSVELSAALIVTPAIRLLLLPLVPLVGKIIGPWLLSSLTVSERGRGAARLRGPGTTSSSD